MISNTSFFCQSPAGLIFNSNCTIMFVLRFEWITSFFFWFAPLTNPEVQRIGQIIQCTYQILISKCDWDASSHRGPDVYAGSQFPLQASFVTGLENIGYLCWLQACCKARCAFFVTNYASCQRQNIHYHWAPELGRIKALYMIYKGIFKL